MTRSQKATLQISSKLPHAGTSIFTVMSQLAREHNALNLSQGFPDFSPPEKLVQLVQKHLQLEHNQYAPMQGVPELRQQLAKKYSSLYNTSIDPDLEVNVTSGATQAIFTAITATISEGDEVIILEPAYDCYEPAVLLNKGKPVFVPLQQPDFSVDWDGLKSRINDRTRMIIINTPHNPSGATLSKADMEELEKITSGTEILVLSDEVYEHIIFDGKSHESVLKYPGLRERSFAIFSFGKTYHCTGWKLGYIFAPGNLMDAFRKIHQFMVFSSNTPMQYALAEYLMEKSAYESLPELYQEKRDLFTNLLRETPFKPLPCSGTYFQLVDYSAISQKPDLAFAKELTEKAKVASIPVSSFYHEQNDSHLLRFCFAKGNSTLEEAVKRLENLAL